MRARGSASILTRSTEFLPPLEQTLDERNVDPKENDAGVSTPQQKTVRWGSSLRKGRGPQKRWSTLPAVSQRVLWDTLHNG